MDSFDHSEAKEKLQKQLQNLEESEEKQKLAWIKKELKDLEKETREKSVTSRKVVVAG
jgi:hypothetical protein